MSKCGLDECDISGCQHSNNTSSPCYSLNTEKLIKQCKNLMHSYAHAGDMKAFEQTEKRLERLQNNG